MTIFQVYVGSLVHDIADLLDGKARPLGAWTWAGTAVGLVLTLVAIVMVARIGQRALARHVVLAAAAAAPVAPP
jgi:hypothetical protein